MVEVRVIKLLPGIEKMVSSAKSKNCSEFDMFGRSLMQNRKSNRPRILPWGTPISIDLIEDVAHPNCTY